MQCVTKPLGLLLLLILHEAKSKINLVAIDVAS